MGRAHRTGQDASGSIADQRDGVDHRPGDAQLLSRGRGLIALRLFQIDGQADIRIAGHMDAPQGGICPVQMAVLHIPSNAHIQDRLALNKGSPAQVNMADRTLGDGPCPDMKVLGCPAQDVIGLDPVDGQTQAIGH